jgi:5-methylcytosine-specific restriction endonuclease McrA
MANMNSRAKRSRRRRLVAQNGPYCQLCGRHLRDHEMTLDHIVPRSEGGSHARSNLRLACHACNHGRHHPR